MGWQGNREGAGATVVFDAGALTAFERGHGRIRGFVAKAGETGVTILVPASALAQVWLGGPRSASLVRLVSVATEVDSLDEVRAKQVGERLGEHGEADIADAHVVCCALDNDAELVTSDPDDMNALVAPGEPLVR